MKNEQITRTTKGDFAAHNDPRMVPVSVFVQIFARGIIAGLVLAVVLAITAFAIVKANQAVSPGIPAPGPGAVEPEPLDPDNTEPIPNGLPTNDPLVIEHEVGGRGLQPERPGDGLN